MRQLGRNIQLSGAIGGARERAARMLRSDNVSPDSAVFELVMATNYAAIGFGAEFVTEGATRSPDIRLTHVEAPEPLYVECKRLSRGQYEQDEQVHYRRHYPSRCHVLRISQPTVSPDAGVDDHVDDPDRKQGFRLAHKNIRQTGHRDGNSSPSLPPPWRREWRWCCSILLGRPLGSISGSGTSRGGSARKEQVNLCRSP